jgi:phage/plasmid-associated DNA primase
MIYCYGEADIGKTQLSLLVSNLIGHSKTVSFTSKQLSNRFEMRRLVGKVFVLASDVEANFMCLEGTSDVFKQMVGRDPIRVETKYKGDEHYMIGDKMVFACSNFTARVRALGDVSAWRSRLVLINADGRSYKDGEADTRFVSNLFADSEEASGIVNLALEGLLQILNDRHWARTPEQMERVEQVLSENQSIHEWAREAISLGDFSEEKAGITTAEAWASYLRWTESKKLQPWSERIFQELATEAVQAIFGKTKSHNLHRGPTAHRGWRGLSLVV